MKDMWHMACTALRTCTLVVQNQSKVGSAEVRLGKVPCTRFDTTIKTPYYHKRSYKDNITK